MTAEPEPPFRRVRNVGRMRFDPRSEFVWNKRVTVDGETLDLGSPVDKAKIRPTRLKRLFNLSWIVPVDHPRLRRPAEKELAES